MDTALQCALSVIVERGSALYLLSMQRIFNLIESATWGFATIPTLVVFGIVFTLFTRFSQIRFFGRMFTGLGRSSTAVGGISSRKAFLLAVGGRVGAGNITGVSVAITLGGPGAVFWMWALAIMGMATMFVECSLAQLYKRKMPDETFRGGPLQTIIYGLGQDFRWLAIIFSVCMIASYGLGVLAFQSQTVVTAVREGTGVGPALGGGALALVFGLIVFGGIRRIASASAFIVPVFALGYIAMALAIIALNLSDVPAVLYAIVANAFGWEEAVSGGVGAAVLHGMQRGLSSNEAGLGSASNVAGAAFAKHPIDQGITQAFGVFIDTIVICSCTALIIMLSDFYVLESSEFDGIAVVQHALAAEIGNWSRPMMSLIILLIVFSFHALEQTLRLPVGYASAQRIVV
ncbi:MAG: alanine/glycine:cation symporter family protein [Pseudomonadota bacterium]